MERLELTEEGIRQSGFSEQYDDICRTHRGEFIEFVNRLANDNIDNIDWWVSAPASRNRVLSGLFRDYTYVCLVDDLIRTDELPNLLVVDSWGLKMAVGDLCAEVGHGSPGYRVIYNRSIASRFGETARQLLSPWRSILRLFLEWLVIRCAAASRHRMPTAEGPNVLIDTFALSPDPKQDRYYPGLSESVGPEVGNRIWFAPQFMNMAIPSLARSAKHYSDTARNWLLKESVLTFSDLIWSAGFLWRKNRIETGGARFKNTDLSGLVKVDLERSSGFRCAIRGLMNYRFIRRLKQSGFEISRAIDWFENHPMDRGWNYGVNRYYGRSRCFGYQGFYPGSDAFRITETEYEAGVTPAELFTMGSGYIPEVRKYCTNMPVSVGPAFRYAYMHNVDIKQRQGSNKDVLVALPYFQEAMAHLCLILDELKARDDDRLFYVKFHPASMDSRYREIWSEAKNIVLVDGPLRDYYDQVSVVMCGPESTASLEAMAQGKSVLIVAIPGAMHQVSVPEVVPEELWRVCTDSTEALRGLEELEGMDWRMSLRSIHELRDQLFSPVNAEGARSFLGVRNNSAAVHGDV